MQPLILQERTVPHLKGLINICLETEAQGHSIAFKVSKYFATRKRFDTYSYLKSLSTQDPLSHSAVRQRSTLVSQRFPPKPFGQSQLKSLTKSVHSAPKRQGSSAQSSMFWSQSGPPHPSGHTQPNLEIIKEIQN